MIPLHEMVERDNRPPSVTVLMLCYNHRKYIDEAIQSVLMQKTNFPVNIVIHDDASPDGSAEVIKKYAAKYPNITAILQPVNVVQNGKHYLPYMFPYITGKYVAHCECDDFWLDEGKLQMQVDYLESNPDCIAVYHNILPVNKFSKYDESCRQEAGKDRGFQDMDEGDFVAGDFSATMQHQIASLVIRNFWQFMTEEDIAFYTKIRCTGDVKLFKMLIGQGRVHHFKERLSAYRRVIDEGDSYSAQVARMRPYEKFKHDFLSFVHLNVLVEHFFGKKYSHKYFQLISADLKSRLKFRRSVLKDVDLSPCNDYKNIPLYAYIAFPFYAASKFLHKVIRKFKAKFKPHE